ncbi:MAG: TVP38/TMEM64 family protein [Nitrospira sp.]|nr:TVP38/TMEM64 family protein [Nitrospira sp.]
MVTTRTGWLKLGALLVVLAGAYAVASWLDLGELLKPEGITDQLRAAGPFGPFVFMLLMATAVVISPIPSLPLDLAAGATYGVTLGTMYAVIGAEIGAILSFLIGRFLGREALTRLLRIDITFCERCSDRHLALVVFLSRLLPIFSFDLVSYGAGLTNMSLRAFAVATLLGMIGPTFLLTYAGEQVVSGEWVLIVFGLAMVSLLLFIPKLMVRYRTARWVEFMRGGTPVAAPENAVETTLAGPCSSCGGPSS